MVGVENDLDFWGLKIKMLMDENVSNVTHLNFLIVEVSYVKVFVVLS